MSKNTENLSPAALEAARTVMEREARREKMRKAREESARRSREKREEIEARVRPAGMNDKVWDLIQTRASDANNGGGWDQYESELEDLVEFLDAVDAVR